MKKTILLFSILLASCAGKQTQEIRTMERLSTASRNDYYVSNRAPLQPLQFIKLPAGSIEPEGWIRRQIELQKDGLCGHLGEISAWLQKGNNAWLKNGGEWGWEEVPYWLRGYGNMAYALKDEALLKDSTIYVSLEPCSHYGKTPPCAELIIRKGIPRVVVGCLDPFPEVSGRGVRMLREAGVEGVTGVMEEEARALNKAFMTLQTKGRPYIILKWAQSEDGFIDRLRTDVSEPVTVLSSPETSRLVHKLRSEVAAIMVGTRTALLDNPSLNVRHWSGNSPVRVVLDRRLVIPDSYRLLNGFSRTLIFTEKEVENRENMEYIRIDFEGPVIRQVLDHLAARKLDSLLVEGGAQLINSFVEADVWDEAMASSTSRWMVRRRLRAP